MAGGESSTIIPLPLARSEALTAGGEPLPLKADVLRRFVLDNPAPVYIADPAGRLLAANTAYRWLAQLAHASGAGGAGESLPAGLRDLFRQVVATGKPVHGRDSLGEARGRRMFVSVHFPIQDAAGQTVAIGGIYTDVTATATDLASLRQNEQRVDDILSATADWVWETDGGFDITYVSSRFIAVTGIPAPLIIGRNLYSIGDFEDTGRAGARVAIDERRPFRDCRFVVKGADGRTRHYRVSGMPLFEELSGEFAGYRGSGAEITAQLEAEQRAGIAETQLRQAIEHSSDGFMLFDAEDRLVLFNRNLRRLLPESGDLIVVGSTYKGIMRGLVRRGLVQDLGDSEEAWIRARLVAHGGTNNTFELAVRGGHWLQVSEDRTVDGGTVVTVTDITAIKNREAGLRAARDAAELSDRAKSSFLANMSHELRTPLNAIIGFSEIMRNEMFGAIGNARYAEYVRDIHDSSSHLLQVINDILDTSKLRAGKVELDEREVDVNRVVEASLRLLHDRAERAAIALEWNPDPALPKLKADELKLRQVLINLLSNAIKFTPAEGRVGVRAARRADGWLTVAVADTGIGIAAEDIPTALAEFGQVDGSMSRRYAGTGLGLPLAKRLVELHGGILDLESEPGRGTTVTIAFPPDRVLG